MRLMTGLSLACLLMMGASATAGATKPTEPDMVNATCKVCHGSNGISPTATFPNLAAQTKTYLDTQLKNFRDNKRADPKAKAYMWSIAGSLSNKEIDKLAAYFSSVPPPKGMTGESPAQLAAGKSIFEKGIASESVPACSACHGAKAGGNMSFPRLAGQHREYLIAQLHAFRSKTRENATMNAVAQNLTDRQIRNVAAYLASL